MSALNEYHLETENWVSKVIMKYNICPFARREVERNSIRYYCSEHTKVMQVMIDFITECQYLDKHPEVETTLFIMPRGFEGFYSYLDIVDVANDKLVDNDYEGVYQLASFHPD